VAEKRLAGETPTMATETVALPKTGNVWLRHFLKRYSGEHEPKNHDPSPNEIDNKVLVFNGPLT